MESGIIFVVSGIYGSCQNVFVCVCGCIDIIDISYTCLLFKCEPSRSDLSKNSGLKNKACNVTLAIQMMTDIQVVGGTARTCIVRLQ